MAKKPKANRLHKKEIIRRLVQLFEHSGESKLHIKNIFGALQAVNHPTKMLIVDALEEMTFSDLLVAEEGGYYRSNIPAREALEGIFRRKRSGEHHFVPDGGGEDIIVSESRSMRAFEGDRVRVALIPTRQGQPLQGEVLEIVSRGRETVVGTLQVERSHAFVLTERLLSTDVFIPRDKIGSAQNGDKVLVKLGEWAAGEKCPTGEIIDVLGREGDNDTEMHAILAEYGLPYGYPENITAAAEKLDATISKAERALREDFRKVPTFTIDPRDAKDFDDALSIRPIGEGLWEVGVHIADVSHYVTEGSIIDREAEDRATSIYLVDRTIPMLPERLCNFICSLRPKEEKLAFSVIFDMTEAGEVKQYRIRKTVIYSDRRFTYEEAQAIIERNGEASAADLAQPGEHPAIDGSMAQPQGEWGREILTLNRIAKALREARFKGGSIGFDRPEVRFEIDESGHPVSTYIKVAKDANKLVEEFMLLANKTVAESVAIVPKGKNPKVLPYRVHDLPEPERLERLSTFVAKFGYKVRTEGTKSEVSRSLNQLLEGAKGKKEESMVEIVALRAMMKARYSIHNIGHYGLMFRHYTHFTSPIRRYPDLLVHRLIAKYAEGGRSVSANKYEHLCEHCSERELVAAAAERASIKYKQTEFMADRIGQEFDGIVSGVTDFGLYVEDALTKCEGMVPLRDLNSDFYDFDEDNFCLVGRQTKRVYALGDHVRYRVERCNLERRLIDFSLVEETSDADMAPTKGGKVSVRSSKGKSAKGQAKKGGAFRSSVPMPPKNKQGKKPKTAGKKAKKSRKR